MTIEELLDKEQIRELRMAYSAYLDTGQYDRLGPLFAEDGRCVYGPEFGGDWVGRDTIVNNFKGAMAPFQKPFECLHYVTNPLITLDGPDRAHGRWYLIDVLTKQFPDTQMQTLGGHNNPFFVLGIYEDDYRKVDGKWLFDTVRLHFAWPNRGASELAHPD